MLKSTFLLLLSEFAVVSSLICETCDGTSCYDKDRWIQEQCLTTTKFCYRLSIDGRVFRRGCSDFPCASLPGVEQDMECRTCSQDRCNNERDNFFDQRGAGVSWKNASGKGRSLMKISVSLLLSAIILIGI